ncbi:hypothetical protein [Bacillus solitudinis]|uniref:hypothetical protein n=1 Tax=Bacillus solitudinis TaxID=2014074 RepID=UPI000C24BA41|nr:hypothetical protein [Bacillus solitudinis]
MVEIAFLVMVLLACWFNIKLSIRQKTILQLLQNVKTEINILKTQTSFLQTKEDAALLDEKRSHLFLLAYQIRDAIHKQEKSIHSYAIEEAPLTHGYSKEELVRMLSSKELLATQRFWQLFNEYVMVHWLSQDQTYKRIFRGHPEDSSSELAQMRLASTKLLRELDLLLQEMRS